MFGHFKNQEGMLKKSVENVFRMFGSVKYCNVFERSLTLSKASFKNTVKIAIL